MSIKGRLLPIFAAASVLAVPLRAQWVNVTGNLAGLPSECGNLCLLSVVPGQDKIIAGVAKRGLWQTADGGATWIQLGQGEGSDKIVNRPSRILYDPTDPIVQEWLSIIEENRSRPEELE